MNEELVKIYTKAYDIINRIQVKKVTVSERKELQELIKILANSEKLDERDTENFQYWFYRYEQDIDEIVKDINSKIQKEKAIIELAEKRIEKLKERLL